MLLIPSQRPLSWAISLVSLLFISAHLVSAATNTVNVAESASWLAAAPIAGFKPLYGEPMTLDKRQSTCLANGSNFCFGDNVNFCATCGICCGASSSGYCCGSDQLCCGVGCCAAGQTCTDGKCILPLATILVTSATQVTVSHVATEQVTVLQAVVSTSTVFTTTEITVSNGGTQTDIVYVTVTAAPAKRDIAGKAHEPRDGSLWATLRLFSKRFSFPWTADIAPRAGDIQARAVKATGGLNPPVSSSTVITTRITQTSDITSFLSTTTTVPTTSVAFTTIVQTKTRVVNAQATITSTSTLTVTPHAPKTETVTRTATNTPTASKTSSSDAAPPPTDPPKSSGSSSSLSSGAIAGIAGGIGGAAVLLLVLALLWWWRRRRNREPPHQDPSSYLEPYIPDMSEPIPGPRGGGTSPSAAQLNRFSATAPHHADAAAAGLAGGAAAGLGAKSLDRYANISGGPGRKSLSPRLPDMAEAPGGEVYEADGTNAPPHHGIYEADSGRPAQPPYPVDAGEMEGTGSPVVGGHSRNTSGVAAGHSRNTSGASHGGYGHAEELDGTGFSPVAEMGDAEGGSERLRGQNPYRQPGAYRDF